MSSSVSTAYAGRPDHGAAGELLSGLFEEHGKSVYGLCRFLLRDPVEAEDAAQQAFLSAHQALLAGTEPREPSAWLAAIARNECRARAHERMRAPLPFQAELDAPVPGPHDTVSARLETAELFRAMDELPGAQRDAVLLRDLCGLSYEETARVLSVSRANVETLIFRGRQRLAGRLEALRAAAAGLAVPVGLRESIAQAVPGFGGSAGSIAAASGAATGIVAKILGVPVVKLTAAGLAALTVTGATLAESRHGDRETSAGAPRSINEGSQLVTSEVAPLPPADNEPNAHTLWAAHDEAAEEQAEARRERAEERREERAEAKEEAREAAEEAAEDAVDEREDAADEAADAAEDAAEAADEAADEAAEAEQDAADERQDASDEAADAAEDAAEEAADAAADAADER